MGGHISSQKQDMFENERKKELRIINKKFKKVDSRKVLLVGPPQSGKTQLFNGIIGQEYSDQYEIMESAQLGFKIYSTNESRYEALNPLKVQCVDAPGSFMRTEIAADYYFEDCDVIFIVVDISLVLDDAKIDKASQFVLRQVSMHHACTRDQKRIPPLICHVFTKQDRIQPAIRKRNEKSIRSLARNGLIGNYLYVSTKTGLGMHEIKKAIIDADIKNHGDKIRPPQKPKKQKPVAPPMTPPMESDPDPYNMLADQEMPQAIPGLMGNTPVDKKERKSNAARRKAKNQDDDVVDNVNGESPDNSGQINVMRAQFAPNIQLGDLMTPSPLKNQ